MSSKNEANGISPNSSNHDDSAVEGIMSGDMDAETDQEASMDAKRMEAEKGI